MTLLLAQSAPPPQALADWLSVAFYLVAAVAAVLVMWRQLSPSRSQPRTIQEPLTVRAQQDYITSQAHAQTIEEIKGELRRHAARRAEIYDEQAAQGERLASLANQSDQQSRELTTLREALSNTNDRIDQVPARVIALLRETKGLL